MLYGSEIWCLREIEMAILRRERGSEDDQGRHGDHK